MEETKTKLEFFDFLIRMVVNMLKQQDKQAILDCEHTLINLLGEKYALEIINTAIIEVSELFPQTGSWICENLPYFEASIKLKEYGAILATRQLINKGFILGKDFSASADGKIIIKPEVKTALLQRLYSWEQVWVESILILQE